MTKSLSSSDNAEKAYVSTTSFSPILGAQATERATKSAQLQDFIDTWRYRFEPEYQRNSTLELGEYLKSKNNPLKKKAL
ncbi:hypothetical protein AB6D15_23720 [Vibrio splendidus]